MKSWRVIVALAAVLSALAITTVSADPRHSRGDGWRGGGGGHSRDWNRPHWGGGSPRYYPDAGTAFWGGVVGGVLGNIFRPEPPPVVITSPPVIVQQPPVIVETPRTIEWCAQRYRSYNLETGTFTGFDGLQHPCP